MRRGAGDDVDQPCIGGVPKSSNEVFVERLKMVQRLLKKSAPVPGGLRQVSLVVLVEVGLVFNCGNNFAFEVLRKFRPENRVRQLLQQNWRDVQIGFERDSVTLQIPQHAQQRQIGFSSGFMQPFQA